MFEFQVGEKVLCYEPDPTKAKVIYEAKILKMEADKRFGASFLVHFQGWSSTWDRNVALDCLLKDNQANRQLQKKLFEAAKVAAKKNKVILHFEHLCTQNLL